jgi:hypothetical protein
MHLGSLPGPSAAIFLVILGLSFAVARLDFIRRRGSKRVPVRRIPTTVKKSAAIPAQPAAVEKSVAPASVTTPVVEQSQVPAVQAKPVDRKAWLPGTSRRVVANLAIGQALPIPMPAPKRPAKAAWRGTPVTWWPQES